jgi:endopolyphosphatase
MLNRMISDKFLKAFGDENNFRKKRGPHFIPIIPSIGNNDLHPNNIITAGPNNILTVLYNIWSPFIPKGQHKTFLNGGYYYTEVIPNKLMVVSLNTLYFYKANTAVNGCKAANQPGTTEIKWLRDVLKKARKNGMKVYLTGHVAPRAKQYTRSCYRKYGQLALRYNDIILGHFYGHSNLDHFFFINAKSLRRRRSRRKFLTDDVDIYDDNEEDIYNDDDDDDDDYDDDDDDEYEEEEEEEDDDVEVLKVESQKEELSSEIQESQDDVDYDDDEENGTVETNVYDINKYTRRLLKHYNKVLPRSRGFLDKEYAVIHINPSIIPTFFPALRIFKYNTTVVTKGDKMDDVDDVDSMRKRRKHRPSVINTFLTPLGYTQYFINLTHANLYPNITPEFTIEYTTWDDYRMKDLTVSSWLQLAQKIVSRGLRSSLWKRVQEHLMVGTRSLIRNKKKKHYEPTDSREKGPEDYIVSELAF